MPIKTYEEFVNENLFGQYSFYGAGSLFPIVSKLASEGKSPQLIYTYLTSLGIDEDRKRSVISKVFLNESIDFNSIDESLYEDELDDLATADAGDLKKGVDPSKAKTDTGVEDAINKLKSGDDESMKDKEEEDKSKDDVEDEEEKKAEEETTKDSKLDALKSALKDAEKLEKIKKILGESFGFDLSEENDPEFLAGVFEYHSVLEKLSKAERDKLKDNDFIFPDNRSWPIHDEKHAKTALVWATWPQYKNKKDQIVKSVLKKYPNLKGFGAAK